MVSFPQPPWIAGSGAFRRRIKCVIKPLCVNTAILINDVGIDICHHLHLCMARITLDCFPLSRRIQFEFVNNTGMPERMENHMGESVFLDELVKGPVDDLTFHRASVAGAEHKIVVDVFITEQVFQLVNFGFPVHQHFSWEVDPPESWSLVLSEQVLYGCFFDTEELLITPLSLRSSSAPSSDTLQFLVDENAGITSINAMRRHIDTIPCQSEHLSHTQRAGERRFQGQQ